MKVWVILMRGDCEVRIRLVGQRQRLRAQVVYSLATADPDISAVNDPSANIFPSPSLLRGSVLPVRRLKRFIALVLVAKISLLDV